VVFLLGWVFDFLFWKKHAGINIAIFLTLCLLGGFLLLLSNGLKPALKSLWLIIPFAFFATITFMRQEPLTFFLAFTFSVLSLGLLTVTYQGGRWTRYSLFDYFNKFLLLIGSIILRPYGYFKQNRIDMAGVRRLPIKPVVRGLMIAVPVVVFFAVLLAAGDLVFRQKINDTFDFFSLERIPEYIFRLMIILFWAYVLIGVFLHAASQSKDGKLIGEDAPVIKHFLGFTEAAIVLGSVIILFLLFVIVQFRYFFGGEVNIGVEGYTYSQYARSGFSELITVAFFSLLMILGLGTITKREDDRQKRAYSGLSVALVALVIVLLVSAYQRLNLAIDWHGFSRLRLYPRVFLIWVGILFVAVIALEIIRRERYFAFAALLASIGFAVSLSMINVDASIVRHNVYRTIEGKYINVNFLTTLSTDAVPALVDGYMDPALPVVTHQGVGAALLCYIHSDMYQDYSTPDWRSFNYSQWAAINALNRVQADIQGFNVNEKVFPIQVETPNHELYVCSNESIR